MQIKVKENKDKSFQIFLLNVRFLVEKIKVTNTKTAKIKMQISFNSKQLCAFS